MPVLTAENLSPVGGEAWPKESRPQQTAVPSGRRPQVWRLSLGPGPVLMDVNRSDSGGEASPLLSIPQAGDRTI